MPRFACKHCPNCRTDKPLASFYRTFGSQDGRTRLCRDCIDAADPVFAQQAEPFEAVEPPASLGLPVKSPDIPPPRRPQPSASSTRSHRTRIIHHGRRLASVTSGRESYPPELVRSFIRSAARRDTAWIETCSVFGCYEPAERHHISYAHPHLFIWLCRKHHAVWHQTIRSMFRQYLIEQGVRVRPDFFLEDRLSALQNPPPPALPPSSRTTEGTTAEEPLPP